MSYFFVLCFLSLVVQACAADQSLTKSPIQPNTNGQKGQSSTQSPIQSSTTGSHGQSSTQSPIQPSTTGPQVHNATFALANETGFVCALVTGVFQLSINYKDKSGADLTNALYIDSSVLSKVEGRCGSTEQILTVDFYNGWKFGFAFTRDSPDTEAQYSTKNLTLTYLVDSSHGFLNPNTSGQVFSAYTGSDLYTAKNGKNYLCKAKKTLSFNDTVTTLTVTDLHLQAFKSTPSPNFEGDTNECLADSESDSNLVPIIVGVCLAALVIVILVAYFIGRWRTSRNSAYQPV